MRQQINSQKEFDEYIKGDFDTFFEDWGDQYL